MTKVDKGISLLSAHFSLQVLLQNPSHESNAICQYTNVRLFGTKGTIDIPLCKIGCVGEVGLMLGRKYIDGKTHDLSGFGVDFSKAVKLNCEAKNGLVKLSVDDKVVYNGDFKQDIGKIAGTQIKFQGTLMVSQFELKENK